MYRSLLLRHLLLIEIIRICRPLSLLTGLSGLYRLLLYRRLLYNGLLHRGLYRSLRLRHNGRLYGRRSFFFLQYNRRLCGLLRYAHFYIGLLNDGRCLLSHRNLHCRFFLFRLSCTLGRCCFRAVDVRKGIAYFFLLYGRKHYGRCVSYLIDSYLSFKPHGREDSLLLFFSKRREGNCRRVCDR